MKKNAIQWLPHSDNECQVSINNDWSCILSNQSVVRMYKFITALLTGLVLLNRTHKRKNIDSKLANVATSKVFRNGSLDVIWAILIEYSYQTAKVSALYECTDGPAGKPANNPRNQDRLGAVRWTIPELTVCVYWRPRVRIWPWFGSNPDQDPKWRSGTVVNTDNMACIF